MFLKAESGGLVHEIANSTFVVEIEKALMVVDGALDPLLARLVNFIEVLMKITAESGLVDFQAEADGRLRFDQVQDFIVSMGGEPLDQLSVLLFGNFFAEGVGSSLFLHNIFRVKDLTI